MSAGDPESGLPDGNRRSSLSKSLDDSSLPGVRYVDDSTTDHPASAVDHEHQQMHAEDQPKGCRQMDHEKMISILQSRKRADRDEDEEDEDESAISFCNTDSTCFKVFSISTMVLGVVMSVMMISVGSYYLHDCNIQKYIPIYLVVGGVLGIPYGLLNFVRSLEPFKHTSSLNSIYYFANLVTSIWFLAGCAWVYRAYEPNYVDKTSKDYCNKTLYLFSFWLLNFSFIVVGIFVIVGCCALCCWCCGKILESVAEE